VLPEKELLFTIKDDDFEIQTFCSGGKGGQNQNKRFTGVRIIHKESGAVGECREEREQLQNKKRALKKLTETPKFKIWLNRKIYELDNKKTIEQEVEKMLDEKNLKAEVKDEDGKWVSET
jgi:protein subunit release factor B